MDDFDKSTWISDFSGELYQNGKVITTCCGEAEEGLVIKGISFSDYLIEGLQGYADLVENNGNGDSIVPMEEAFAYADPKYRLLTENECIPVIDDQCPGELVLTDVDLPPSNPIFSGDLVTVGQLGTFYAFNAESTDPEGDTIKYGWDWNKDGVLNEHDYFWWSYWHGYDVSEWSDYYDSGEACSMQNAWNEPGVYAVRVKAQDEHGAKRTENYYYLGLWSRPKYYIEGFE